jgi:hypothetical protein
LRSWWIFRVWPKRWQYDYKYLIILNYFFFCKHGRNAILRRNAGIASARNAIDIFPMGYA